MWAKSKDDYNITSRLLSCQNRSNMTRAQLYTVETICLKAMVACTVLSKRTGIDCLHQSSKKLLWRSWRSGTDDGRIK